MAIWQKALSENSSLVYIDGRLDQSQTAPLDAQLTALLADGRIHLIIDLTQTNYINSGGLRCLISAWRKARQQGGNLVLCGLSPRLQEVFSMVGLDKLFQIVPSVADAQKLLATT